MHGNKNYFHSFFPLKSISFVLNLEGNTLRHSDTDSSAEDAVTTDLSLSAVLHHCTEKT